MSKYNPAKYQWAKDQGLCVGCRKRQAAAGFVLCLECREMAKRYRDNHKKNGDNEAQNKYLRKLRAARKANGLCVICGEPLKEWSVTCDPCRLKRREQERKRNAKRKGEEAK